MYSSLLVKSNLTSKSERGEVFRRRAGMLIPKDTAKEFQDEYDKLYLDFDNKILSDEELKNRYILYQLLNYEAFIRATITKHLKN